MGLVGKAAGERDLADRLGGRQHHLPRRFQPQPDKVGVRRVYERLLERAAEMADAGRDLSGQFFDLPRALQMLPEVALDPSPLRAKVEALFAERSLGGDNDAVLLRGRRGRA